MDALMAHNVVDSSLRVVLIYFLIPLMAFTGRLSSLCQRNLHFTLSLAG